MTSSTKSFTAASWIREPTSRVLAVYRLDYCNSLRFYLLTMTYTRDVLKYFFFISVVYQVGWHTRKSSKENVMEIAVERCLWQIGCRLLSDTHAPSPHDEVMSADPSEPCACVTDGNDCKLDQTVTS